MKTTEYFNIENIRDVFLTKIRQKKNKGIDKVSPEFFYSNINSEIQIIYTKCNNGKFNFSPYLENLKLKGRKKLPRVISIPTVRDRIVLSILKDILHENFPECINKKLPNQYIAEIKKFIKEGDDIYFIQTDISKFYDTIDRSVLMSKLRTKIINENIIKLIESAISTPTVPINTNRNEKKKFINKHGVPQGLAISNILAQIYLNDFDKIIKKRKYFYLRYVDDILILNNSEITRYRISNIAKSLKKINLDLNPEKTNQGKLDKGIVYLGYNISNNISICEKNVQRFIQRITAKFTWLKQGFLVKTKRPSWLISDDNRFIQVFMEELNETITGARDEHKNYGWLFYFSEINDMNLLFRLDKIISGFFEKLDIFENKAPCELKKLVRTYYEIRYSEKKNYIYNYSLHDTILKKRKFLIYRGQIDPNQIYNDSEIIAYYNKYKFKRLKELDKDIGYKYF